MAGLPKDTRAVRRLWSGLKRLARTIGDWQARVFLTLVYFVVVAPFALGLRWAADPLSLKARAPSRWRLRPATDATPLERARRQF